MPYTLTNSDGTTLATVADGQANGPGFSNATTNLVLPGPNFVGYGQYLNQNLINLLENFAGNSAPSSGPNVQGQLWFNKSNETLYVFANDTTGYVPVSGILVDATQPPVAQPTGTIWYNTTTNQIFIYDANGTPHLVGPLYTAQQGVSGAIPIVLNDANAVGVTHNVVSLQFGTTTFAIISSDVAFAPTPAIPGFSLIKPGINFNTNIISGTININVIGNLTGNVAGNLTGNVTGNVTGNIVGNVTGNLVGNVTGNLTGNVTGNVTGNIAATSASVTALTSTTVTTNSLQATSGNLTGITQTSTQNLLVSGASILSGVTASTVSAAIIGNTGATVTGTLSAGPQNNITSATGLSTLLAANGNIVTLVSGTAALTNLTTSNAVVTGGSVTGLSALASQTLAVSGATYLAGTTNATTVNAVTLGNAGTIITGTLTSGAQNAITSALALTQVGALTAGTWNANVVQPTYGGTGVNNGTNTLTLNDSYTLNQSVSSGAAPSFLGSNFTGTAPYLTAGAVTNGVYSNGSYSNPSWIASLAYSKLTGTPTNVSTFTNDAGYITSAPAVGVGQTYQDVTLSRNPHTTYTNNTGKPIQVIITYNVTFNGFADAWVDVNGVTVAHAGFSTGNGTLPQGFATIPLTFIVPNGATYIAQGYVGYNRWVELR